MDANITFGQATERLGNLICRSPIEWLSLDSLKELLCDYESIIAASEERQDILQFVMPLTECYLRIENYCSKAVVKTDN
ncbi:hypothetical protein PF010_g20060 [Phytophthora fragariae]|nr:hypothetical protein PF010_g20060 [Phytophthora fragariae]